MMRKLTAFLLVLLFASSVSFAELAEKEIVAEGTARAGSAQSKEAALNRALRNAVEQAVGTIIDSETMVENFQLLDDKIYSETKGYVKSYEILSDNGGEGSVYTVKVKAVVALGALGQSIKGLGIIREKMNYPRVMVLVGDYVDGVEQASHVIGTEIEKVFMESKFPIVSKNQMEMIKERDATLSYADPAKAAALGRRYGAEVVIVGQGSSSLMDTSTPYGVSVFAYQAHVEVKAVKTDNAQILAVDSLNQTARANGRVPAANKALADAAQSVSKNIMAKIVEAWRSEVYNETSVEIICDNADVAKSSAMKKALGAINEVKGVSERSLVGSTLELDVRFFGTPDQLATILSELKEPAVKIISKTPSRIDIRFID
jgi:hypothetical protein